VDPIGMTRLMGVEIPTQRGTNFEENGAAHQINVLEKSSIMARRRSVLKLP